MSKESSDYEVEYRSTIQPRTAVRTQSRQSTGGGYPSGGGGGGKNILELNIWPLGFVVNHGE